jgi:hypothetical protein
MGTGSSGTMSILLQVRAGSCGGRGKPFQQLTILLSEQNGYGLEYKLQSLIGLLSFPSITTSRLT